MNKRLIHIVPLLLLLIKATGCGDQSTNTPSEPEPEEPGPEESKGSTENLGYPDDYRSIADYSQRDQWGPYNVHDPSCLEVDEWVYCFNTDVGYGGLPRAGIMVRRTRNFVDWQFLGFAFDGIPQQAATYVSSHNDGKHPGGIWAPYIMKWNNTFRLYYSVSVIGSDASYIGLATSDNIEGPWQQQGPVVTSTHDDPVNAIDPSVVVNPDNGGHWLVYGSWFGSLNMVQLNPETGRPVDQGSMGSPIVRRNGHSSGAAAPIEGPEVIYNPEFDKYYLFVSYGDLLTNYNIRVGRADQPQGPYTDWNGVDMSESTDNWPVIMAAYQFKNHDGWQGVGHCGVFTKGDDFYIAHQGRPGFDRNLMVMHARKLYWTDDGWPLMQPERYVPDLQADITTDSLTGTWEYLELQPTPQGSNTKNHSTLLSLNEDGSVEGSLNGTWTLKDKMITLETESQTLHLVARHGWDWENKRRTFMYTGIKSNGITVWGKKVGS